MRRLTAIALLSLAPTAAMADGTLPQMDLKNPLTLDQLGWMAVIMVVLYLLLSRWALPEMGKVLANRAAAIERDLTAARAAKTAADQAAQELNATLKHARHAAQAQVAASVERAKAEAALNAAALHAKLEEKLAQSEAQIEAGRAQAMAAIKPVAEQAAQSILLRLTGVAPEDGQLGQRVDDALAARKAA
jgi:F-type H+-transporting ATPase subunit b